MKKTKFYAGIASIGASAVFVVLFFVLLKRKKNLAAVFAALSAVTGVSGAVLLILDAKERADEKALEDDEQLECSDFDFDALDNDEIDCSFESNGETETD